MDIGQIFSTTILSGSLWVAIAVAAAAGLVAFLSPCVLPVVPGYLGYVSGLAGGGSAASGAVGPLAGGSAGKGAKRSGRSSRAVRAPKNGTDAARRASARMALGAVLFVAGFAAVFMVLGGFVGALGHLLQAHAVWVNRISGVIVIAMGLVFLGLVPGLSGEKRSSRLPDAGLWGAPLMGMVFGFSWTPCIGPTYAAVVALSLEDASPLRGAILALAYSLGLGIPFVVFALLFQRALGASRFLARHRRTISWISGGLLIAIGILLLTGQWSTWMGQLQSVIGTYETAV